ncbi:n-alkane-inducible cytochrome P-450 [Xylaria scruposa]|nr:n-alkane-inducible cytochrome P-450 [Xylaria scruposa]
MPSTVYRRVRVPVTISMSVRARLNMRSRLILFSTALRLWPPVPTNVRVALRDTALPRGGGQLGDEPILVPKGYAVQYNVYAMHRRPDLFGIDANEFCPERWKQQARPWEFFPFNGGPRICLGRQYALTEALLVLACFTQEFSSIESKDPRSWTESLTLTAGHAYGVHVVLRSRQQRQRNLKE